MSNAIVPKAPFWYWSIVAFAITWTAFGVFAWMLDLRIGAAHVASLSDTQLELYAQRPQWVLVVYMVAVFSGLIGAVGLLTRQAWAVVAFGISLVAILTHLDDTYVVMGALNRFGLAGTSSLLMLCIVAIAAALLWFSISARTNEWIR